MGRKLCVVISCVIAISFLLPLSVYADPADTDSPPWDGSQNIYVNRSLLETNDALFVFEYNLPYGALPTADANANYIFRLIDTDGITEIGQALPYSFQTDRGYNHGVASFYFTYDERNGADNVLGTADDLFLWNDNLIIRISQNPATYTTPQDYDVTIPNNAYSILTTTDDNKDQLADRLLVIASRLEAWWTLTLTESQDPGTVFSANGESYFRAVIFGCQSMAPGMFFVQSVPADTSKRVWGTTLSDTYKQRLAGADGIYGTADDNWIYSLTLKPTADLLNIPVVLLFGLLVVAGCVWLVYKSNQKWQTPMPGYVGSLLLVMCGGMMFLGLQMVALIGFGLVVVGGYLLFMRKA